MALPLFAPLAPLLPVFKVLALGSVKFIGVGIGAAFAPVLTANFLVGMSAGTPLKYAQFRHKRGRYTEAQLQVIEQANQLVKQSLDEKDEHLTRQEARAFLKEVLMGTVEGMKNSVLSIPVQLARFSRVLIDFIKKPFSSSGS